jgi:hypothetical protein
MARFEKGHSGRPSGSRNKLAQRVFDDIFRHWLEPAGNDLCKGQAALELLYRENPGGYLKLTASVLPKEFVFDHAVSELDDEDLYHAIEMWRARAIADRQAQAIELKPVPRRFCAMAEIDPDKVVAALEAEQSRRLQAKLDAGEVVSILTVVVIGDDDEDIEDATARAIAKHPAPDGRPVHREFFYVTTGVPRAGADEAEPAPQTQSSEGDSSPSSEPAASSLLTCSRPTYVRMIVSNGNDDGDPGQIVEAWYTIEEGLLVLRDHDDKVITSRAMLAGDDPAVLARSLLREAEQPQDFNRPIHYPKIGLA